MVRLNPSECRSTGFFERDPAPAACDIESPPEINLETRWLRLLCHFGENKQIERRKSPEHWGDDRNKIPPCQGLSSKIWWRGISVRRVFRAGPDLTSEGRERPGSPPARVSSPVRYWYIRTTSRRPSPSTSAIRSARRVVHEGRLPVGRPAPRTRPSGVWKKTRTRCVLSSHHTTSSRPSPSRSPTAMAGDAASNCSVFTMRLRRHLPVAVAVVDRDALPVDLRRRRRRASA